MVSAKSDMVSRSDISVSIPVTLVDAQQSKLQLKEGVYVAGGTLLQLNWEANEAMSKQIISLNNLTELKDIEVIKEGQKHFVKIGALTTINECLHSSIMTKYCPLFVTACQNIAAPAVRNLATLGGNVASRIGDSLPVLLVLDAEITCLINGEKKTKKISEWLKESRDSSFLLIDIRIPYKEKQFSYYYKKVGRREAFTPAIVSVSGMWRFEKGELLDVRLAVGGGSHEPVRLYQVEELLKKDGCEYSSELVFSKIINEFNSYSDSFFNDQYRKKVAANLIISELKKQFIY
ncbi:xanthine dehydrogenase C subunit [Metabacillus crassostreae]|uniref:FAD binding domain-containing protein n=1 Tax=Metabacillus crassostreae TaxID=929098 RepID=UPI00195EED24|nr:FAD binding domain-containing protein [Metabacillus crassostreae]MBM7603653.1 xanthine dehydrogenase C subunit [Metabacillus crassostreae]